MTFFFLSAEVMPNWPFFKACPTGRFGQLAGIDLNDNVMIGRWPKPPASGLRPDWLLFGPMGLVTTPEYHLPCRNFQTSMRAKANSSDRCTKGTALATFSETESSSHDGTTNNDIAMFRKKRRAKRPPSFDSQVTLFHLLQAVSDPLLEELACTAHELMLETLFCSERKAKFAPTVCSTPLGPVT
jgi:hypothetical protein